jgi:hypothetical protein
MAAPRSGLFASHACITGLTTIGVFTPVGWIVFTRMLWGASALASDRMMPTTPCLAAE